MAFTIKVFEKDDYLFSLLKMRLETMFPDAYIINAIEDPGRSDCLDFSEFTKIIYDPRNIDMSDFKDAVPIFDERGVIDCRKIADRLGLITSLRKNADTISISSGVSVALIPYVYMDDREALIDRLAGLAVGGHNPKFHRVAAVGIEIEEVEVFGQLVVAEISAVEVARGEQRAERAVAPVVREALVVTDGAPRLPRFDVAAERCSSRHADCAVELNAVLHQHVEHARGEHSAHCAAFKNQSAFHLGFSS